MFKLKLVVASLVCSGASVAWADSLASATASVSDITLTLADLDPSDGQTPGLQLTDVTGALLIGAYIPDFHSVNLMSPSIYLPTAPVSYALGDGAGTFVQATVSSTDLYAFGSLPYLPSSWNLVAIASAYGNYLLSPHSSLTVTANLSFSYSCPVSAAPKSCKPSVQSYGSLVGISSDYTQTIYGEADYRFDQYASSDYTFTAPFSATAVNDTAEQLKVGLGLGSSVLVTVAVPEPASPALWVAGVGLVGWAAKRRRQAVRVGQ